MKQDSFIEACNKSLLNLKGIPNNEKLVDYIVSMQRPSRQRKIESDVTENDLNDIPSLVKRVNQIDGPKVEWDNERNCYGLKADRMYKKGKLVTTYGGIKYLKEVHGDYVVKANEIHIDGRFGFKLSEKGRWINESDRDRKIVNVTLGRDIRATRIIQPGEWIFADYGPDYVRNY